MSFDLLPRDILYSHFDQNTLCTLSKTNKFLKELCSPLHASGYINKANELIKLRKFEKAEIILVNGLSAQVVQGKTTYDYHIPIIRKLFDLYNTNVTKLPYADRIIRQAKKFYSAEPHPLYKVDKNGKTIFIKHNLLEYSRNTKYLIEALQEFKGVNVFIHIKSFSFGSDFFAFTNKDSSEVQSFTYDPNCCDEDQLCNSHTIEKIKNTHEQLRVTTTLNEQKISLLKQK